MHYRCLDQVFTPTSTRQELLQGAGKQEHVPLTAALYCGTNWLT
jgi:hypothetical protein